MSSVTNLDNHAAHGIIRRRKKEGEKSHSVEVIIAAGGDVLQVVKE